MAIITELDNALQDVREPQVKFMNRVADMMKDKSNTNSSIIGGDSFNATVPVYRGINYGNGYITTGSPSNSLQFSTFPASFYKVDFVRAYNLGIGVDVVLKNFSGAPGPIANYNIPLTFNLFRTLPVGELTPYGSNQEPVLVFPLGTLTWSDTTLPGFTWAGSNPSTNINLLDTIEYRTYLSAGHFDFGNTNLYNVNNKITIQQYESVINNNVSWQALIVYDIANLTGAQQAHFDSLMGGLNTDYGLSLTLPFKPFGLLASYRPVN